MPERRLNPLRATPRDTCPPRGLPIVLLAGGRHLARLDHDEGRAVAPHPDSPGLRRSRLRPLPCSACDAAWARDLPRVHLSSRTALSLVSWALGGPALRAKNPASITATAHREKVSRPATPDRSPGEETR